MKKTYHTPNLLLIPVLFVVLAFASCSKDKSSSSTNTGTSTTTTATPTTLGLYGVDSSIYKLLFMSISKIGTSTVDYGLLFDTGSGGMVIDASGILPSSMIGTSGFTFTGDSVVVNGITITNQTNIVEYGDDSTSVDKVYGNLAYAAVTVGDVNGNIVIKRLPFFLYYKAVDYQGNKYDAHEFDTFGVSPEYDITFSNNAYITSPFTYFTPGTGLTSGFKMAALSASDFSYEGTYAPVITLGLTASDLSSSSGFNMTQLYFYAGDGYAPIIPTTVVYNGKTVSTDVVYDTGTEPYSYIEDPTATTSLSLLPVNSTVAVSTTAGFSYSYNVTSTDNLTYIENPTTTGADVSILSLEFFLNNEYLLDYTNHKLGLKNN